MNYSVAGQGPLRVPALADYEPALIPEFTSATQEPATIDLVKLWAAVWRNRLIIATIVVVSAEFAQSYIAHARSSRRSSPRRARTFVSRSIPMHR